MKTNTLEFFLNDFLWIQRIQWIMIKSKTSMVTRDVLHLTTVTFLDVVVKKNFPLLPVDWYLFQVGTSNRYLPRVSNENALFISSTGNVSVSSWVITLVTMPLLGFVMIHWIRWIQWNSSRKNSIVIQLHGTYKHKMMFVHSNMSSATWHHFSSNELCCNQSDDCTKQRNFTCDSVK